MNNIEELISKQLKFQLPVNVSYFQQDTCQTVGNGSNLASVHSDGENDWIADKMEEYTHYPSLYNYWIGMQLDRSSSDSGGMCMLEQSKIQIDL